MTSQSIRLVAIAALCCGLMPAMLSAEVASDAERPELAYLKQVNEWRPADPELLLILMGQFANAGRYIEGAEYFARLRSKFDAQLEKPQRALYLIAEASLRAGYAREISVFRRIGWVRETLALLDEAKRLTNGDMFLARWMSGVVRAQLPGFLGERDTAFEDLDWCLQHADRAPHPGWLREVYFQLAALHRDAGDAAKAERYQALSGLRSAEKPVMFTTPFAEDASMGHTFYPRRIREVIPGTVYVLSGFEFTEYYFIVSADHRELISIDAGTRPDAARAAYEALRAKVRSLPPLTTVLVTHAHWDHVGGHSYFRTLNPAVRFVGRSNYKDELARDTKGQLPTLRRFFGQSFRLEDVLSYAPDETIDKPTDVTIGGTRFVLLPTRGGETDDALLVHMPEQGVLFAGDILMPYIGAPFIEEGSYDGLLAAIEQVTALRPRYLLQGHEPLTRIFSSAEMLTDLRTQLIWLGDQARRAMQEGMERGAIHQKNLVPPTLPRSSSNVHLAYLLLRENVINRLYDQESGYWQNGLQGMDALVDADRGAALVDYLGASESQLASAAERMIHDGKPELAAAVLQWVQPRFPESARLKAARRTAYLKLMDKYQEFNPFKFIVYDGQIGENIAQMHEPAVTPGSN